MLLIRDVENIFVDPLKGSKCGLNVKRYQINNIQYFDDFGIITDYEKTFGLEINTRKTNCMAIRKKRTFKSTTADSSCSNIPIEE